MFSVTETYYNAQEKIWSGPKRKDFYGPEITIGEAVLFVLNKTPEKVMQIMDTTGEKLTAKQLVHDSKVLVKNLLKLGLKIGDVVCISAYNIPNITALMLASFLAGLPANPLHPSYDRENIEKIFEITRPKIVFTQVENYAVTKEAAQNVNLEAPIFLLDGELKGVRHISELLDDDGSDLEYMRFPCNELTGDDTAVIINSSGTTGIPKSIPSSHRFLLNRQIFQHPHAHSVVFSFSTLFWASGIWTFTASLISGTTRIITDRPFTAEYFLELVAKYKVTDTILVTPQVVQILQQTHSNDDQRLASLRSILVGGSKVLANTSQQLSDILKDPTKPGFSVAYGMSELCSMATLNDRGVGGRRHGSEGKLLPNTEMRIMDKNGVLLGPQEIGVVQIRTPYKWTGYYRNDVATRKAFVDGWFVSGDVGYFDEDGFLHIVGRENDLIQLQERAIYPAEIENVLMPLAGVEQPIIFGIPDDKAVNLLGLAILRADNAAGRALKEQDVLKFVQENMPKEFQLNGGIYFVEFLPRTVSGKIQRHKVWDMICGVEKQERSKLI